MHIFGIMWMRCSVAADHKLVVFLADCFPTLVLLPFEMRPQALGAVCAREEVSADLRSAAKHCKRIDAGR